MLTGRSITKDVDFAGFARLTVDAAKARSGASSAEAKAVQDAWVTVKVLKATTTKKSGAGKSGAGKSGAGKSGAGKSGAGKSGAGPKG